MQGQASALEGGTKAGMIETEIKTRNKLLASLSAADIQALEPHLERIDMKLRQEIERSGEIIHRAVFPESGLLSVVAMLPRGRDIEVGIIGRDGMAGHVSILP